MCYNKPVLFSGVDLAFMDSIPRCFSASVSAFEQADASGIQNKTNAKGTFFALSAYIFALNGGSAM
jgi:hypothetical protein